MDYPRLVINIKSIGDNVKIIVEMAKKENINIAGVTKVFCGNKDIAKAYVEGGVKYLADSRIENLKKLKELNLPKIMLRLPMISEVRKVIQYSDISLNSELDTIVALSKAAIELEKVHGVILMVDLGDLREGFFHDEDLYKVVESIIELKGIKLMGIGTNLTCYGGIIPNETILERLNIIKDNIRQKYSLELDVVSGGNSSTIHLLGKGKLHGINNLRIGEALVLGKETAYGEQIHGTKKDAFILQAEIIEIKEKPSIPIGDIGMDAFGNIPTFVDRGVRKRIICAIGKQDVNFEDIFPRDKDLIILGGSSDHLILDGSDSHINYRTGDIIEFNLDYGSLLATMTSSYVKKVLN